MMLKESFEISMLSTGGNLDSKILVSTATFFGVAFVGASLDIERR